MTEGYAAAIQANDVSISIAAELRYGQLSGRAFHRMRFRSEDIVMQKTRQRPPEITGRAEACHAVTTAISVGGSMASLFSIGGFDQILRAVLGNDAEDGVIINGEAVRSWTLLQQFGEGRWLLRPGAYCTQVQLSFVQGSLAQTSFHFLCADQVPLLTDPAPYYVEAPVGAVLNAAENFGIVTVGGSAVDGCVRQLQITLQRDGATAEYGMGPGGAAGIVPGTFLATGQIQMFFKSFNLYRRFANDDDEEITVSVDDGVGNAYRFAFMAGALQNPRINAGGRNTSILATFDIEGNPLPEGGTFSIARTSDPASALLAGQPLMLDGQPIFP